jgi:hypothetical protein
MLSTSFESRDDDVSGMLHDVSLREPVEVEASLQDDVERLLDIAGQLFSAIERQIHRIEEELVFACGEQVRAYAQTVFKERLIRCAQSWNDEPMSTSSRTDFATIPRVRYCRSR